MRRQRMGTGRDGGDRGSDSDKEKEIWLWVVDYEGWYQVSNLGSVRKMNSDGTVNRVLVARRPGGGYLSVWVHNAVESHRCYVHHLVAAAFIGPRPEGREVNHKDLNKQNNRVDNLEYTTHRRNIRHAVRNGVYLGHYGEDNPRAKIGWKEVTKIRELYATGKYRQKELADMFGLKSDARISEIVNGKAWIEK